MTNLPFPSNDRQLQPMPTDLVHDAGDAPWKKLHPTEALPMCFEIRLRTGEIKTYTYGDFRGTRLVHAGHLVIHVYAMEKTQITVEGRHLGELATHISLGKIRWFGESPRCEMASPESGSYIERILIEEQRSQVIENHLLHDGKQCMELTDFQCG